MKHISIMILSILLAGCATTYKSYQFGSLTNSHWNNYSLRDLPAADFQLEFSKIKGGCNVEAYKLPVPSPSCVQPPKNDCTGMTGFALGFCRGFTPSMKCDYSAVNIAKSARTEIFTNCMISKGWQLETKAGLGGDSSGGYFEYVAYDNNNEYFVKKGTIRKSGAIYSAVVRRNKKGSSSNSYQGVYYFDTASNTLKVDSALPVAIAKDSAAVIILKRLKAY